MKKTICIILFILPSFILSAQTNIDSLVNMLNSPELKIDNQIELHKKITRFYSSSNWGKCLEYSKQGLLLAEKKKNAEDIAYFYNLMGYAYFYSENDFNTSLICLNKALEWANKSNNKALIMVIYSSIGTIHKEKHDYTSATDYYMKAIAANDTLSKYKATVLVNLSTVHRALNHWDRAVEYLEQALYISRKLNLDYEEMGAYYALATIYSDKGDADKAIELGKKALEISKQINDKQFQIISTLLLASSYSIKDEHDKALQYAYEGLHIAEKFGVNDILTGSWITLSDIYRKMERYKDSEAMALKAWAVDSISLEEGAFSAINLAIANIHMGNKSKAEGFIWKYQDIMSKGNDNQMNKLLADMEVKYETEKKEMQIAALEKDRKLYMGLGIAVVFSMLSVIGLLIYRHRTVRQKKEIAEQRITQLEQKQELIAVQSALKAEKNERELIANDLHDSVSSLLTVVKNNLNLYSDSEPKDTNFFNNAFEVLSRSITELRRVVYHLKSFILTKEGLAAALDDYCRFIPNAKLHFKGLNRRFDSDKEYVLYDSACELINNALKHSDASKIDVHLNVDEQTVYLSIADNGKGFDLDKITPGIGLNNIRSNLSVFNGSLDILSETGKGTEANIEMEA